MWSTEVCLLWRAGVRSSLPASWSEWQAAWYLWEAAVPRGRPGLGLAKHSETSTGGPVTSCYPVLHRVWSTQHLHVLPPRGWPCFPRPSLAWTWQTVQHLLPNIEMNDYKKCYFWRHSSRLCIWQKVLGNRQCGMYWEGKKINLCICLLTSWRHIGTYFWHINEFCLI